MKKGERVFFWIGSISGLLMLIVFLFVMVFHSEETTGTSDFERQLQEIQDSYMTHDERLEQIMLSFEREMELYYPEVYEVMQKPAYEDFDEREKQIMKLVFEELKRRIEAEIGFENLDPSVLESLEQEIADLK